METFTIQRRQPPEEFIRTFRQATGKDFTDKAFYRLNEKLLEPVSCFGCCPRPRILVPGDIVLIPSPPWTTTHTPEEFQKLSGICR